MQLQEVRFGTPRRVLNRLFGTHTASILANQIHFAVGGYESVWPTVFHVLWMKYEKNEPLDFWGITHRAKPCEEFWRNRLTNGELVVRLEDRLDSNDAIMFVNQYTDRTWKFEVTQGSAKAQIGHLYHN